MGHLQQAGRVGMPGQQYQCRHHGRPHGRAFRPPASASRRDFEGRDHFGHEPAQGLVDGEVAQPQDQTPAAGVHEGLGLLGHLVDRAHQVVGQVGVGGRTAPEVAAALGVAPGQGLGIGVEEAAVGPVGAGDLLERTTDLVAVAGPAGADLRSKASRPTCQLVRSARRAAMRRLTFSPPPPTSTGGSCCTGLGSQ